MTAQPARRRQQTIRGAILGAVLTVVFVALAGLGGYTLANSQEGRIVERDDRPVVRLPATPNAMLAVTDEDGRLQSLVVATLLPVGRGGSIVTVPVNADASGGFGEQRRPLDAIFAAAAPSSDSSAGDDTGGSSAGVADMAAQADALRVEVEAMLGLTLERALVVDPGGLVELLSGIRSVEVVLRSDVIDADRDEPVVVADVVADPAAASDTTTEDAASEGDADGAGSEEDGDTAAADESDADAEAGDDGSDGDGAVGDAGSDVETDASGEDAEDEPDAGPSQTDVGANAPDENDAPDAVPATALPVTLTTAEVAAVLTADPETEPAYEHHIVDVDVWSAVAAETPIPGGQVPRDEFGDPVPPTSAVELFERLLSGEVAVRDLATRASTVGIDGLDVVDTVIVDPNDVNLVFALVSPALVASANEGPTYRLEIGFSDEQLATTETFATNSEVGRRLIGELVFYRANVVSIDETPAPGGAPAVTRIVIADESYRDGMGTLAQAVFGEAEIVVADTLIEGVDVTITLGTGFLDATTE